MKILVNAQDKAVGGIVRMMNTFVESVLKTDPTVSFHFAVASSGIGMDISDRRRGKETLHGFKADHLVLSRDYYPEMLKRSGSLAELKNNLVELVDFYLECLERSKPDVILINGTYYRPWALLQAARQKNIPYVVYVHGSIVQEAKGVSEPILSLLKEMEKDFYSENADYIFPSIAALKGTVFSGRANPDKFHVIYNSLDEAFFVPKKPRTNIQKTVGFALRWEEVKNTDFILDFIKYNRTAPNPYQIKVVSDLVAEKSKLFQDQFTEFLPPKTMAEMIAFYQEMDVVINPSFFETFGYVPAEAVAGGTPALVSPLQGISEVFLKCGLERMISDFSDVSAIHEKIPAIIQRGISRKEIEDLRMELDPFRLSKKIVAVLTKAEKLK
ncbi:MAG: glycosyltransferase family 4 protein [Candidatus Paceibacterota bacterium]|jgi:glycosyltransferase involved in cell wall biosynthesis|nr:glycosyltransferase family 4 protein [Candidatus Paceibacterota bacterium]